MTALTRELIDSRLPQQVRSPTDPQSLPKAELRAGMARTLAARPAGQDGVWVFAYGALLWERNFAWDREEVCTVHGLARRYCVWDNRSRGTPERPGLTLGLLADGGGDDCTTAAIHLPEAELEEAFWAIWSQEMAGGYYAAHWVDAARAGGGPPLPVLILAADPAHPLFAGRLPMDRTAELLASSVGKGGTAAEYLMNTADSLRDRGCPDPYLDELVEKVAARLA